MEVDEEGDGAAERLGVEEGREGRRVAGAEGVEVGDAVVDDGADVRDVGGEAVEAVGEAVALVVEGADGEARLSEVDAGELDEPAGLAGEAVDEGDDADDGLRGEWSPRLGEDVESPGIVK